LDEKYNDVSQPAWAAVVALVAISESLSFSLWWLSEKDTEIGHYMPFLHFPKIKV
jgi:hypothetical protein